MACGFRFFAFWSSTAGVFLCLGVLALSTAGCGGNPGPDKVYEKYLEHLRDGDLAGAFLLTSKSAKTRLAAAERNWKGGLPDALVPRDEAFPQDADGTGRIVFVRCAGGPKGLGIVPLPADAPDRIVSHRADGDRAWVTVKTPLGPREADLLREDGRWRVALRLP